MRTFYTPYEIPPLYHYTSKYVLESMLESNELWLTHINYQNDNVEYNYAISLLFRVLEEEYEGLQLMIGDGHPSAKGPDPLTTSEQDIYTFSFTSEPDLLSQWRGYCHNGGYSLAINREQLKTALELYHLRLGACSYEEEAQRNMIRAAIGVSPEGYKELKRGHVDKNFYDRNNMMYFKRMRLTKAIFANIAPFIKHPAFSEEKEWRIATQNEEARAMTPSRGMPLMMREDRFPTHFRTSGNVQVPYIKLPLSNTLDAKYSKVQFDEIIVSPSADKSYLDLAQELCAGGQSLNARRSNIPFRTDLSR